MNTPTAHSTTVPSRLTPLEILGGLPYGLDPTAPELPRATGDSPRAAIERAVLPALLRPPCVVSFSGGRDSSAVLAVATHIARRHGLPEPVPVTLRFAAPQSDESQWQERVVEFLGLKNWTRLDLTDELDWVGPLAAATLGRHGLGWPPNAHFHQPILTRARGGSLLTGIDGDGLLAAWRWRRVSDLLTGTVRPEPRDILRLLQVLSPPAVRAAVDNRRVADWHPWLRPAAAREIARRWNADGASEPVTWNARVRDYSRRRHLRLTVHSMNLMAMDHDVVASHPLADPGFLSALGASKRWRGYTDRTATMRALFGDLLPPDVVARPTKALFSQVFTSDDRSRTFLGDWTGAGVDQSLVDVDALRAMWMGNRTPSLTVLMLQSAWLASQQARGAHGTGVDGR